MSQDSTIVSMSLRDVSFSEIPPGVDEFTRLDEFIRLHEPTWNAARLAVECPEDREHSACAILSIGVAALQLRKMADSDQERACFRRIASVALHAAWQVTQEAP
jgi:hypothetical protein